ncbi:winged helix-turn-helix domain-containing protein [Roseomonas harenae]|uniref:winged helix-turn-helix domain-containing protein n=1 Tax=Muricoccus harenae TaxID=2692566 RepID=UPI002E2D5BA8|nr:winged helix-turn-helix domain-containing protein [Roseomonas harenae]
MGSSTFSGAMLRAPQQILSRAQLLAATRGHDQEVYDRSIDVLILRLRLKLGRDASQPMLIKTRRGLNYILTEPAEVIRDTGQRRVAREPVDAVPELGAGAQD